MIEMELKRFRFPTWIFSSARIFQRRRRRETNWRHFELFPRLSTAALHTINIETRETSLRFWRFPVFLLPSTSTRCILTIIFKSFLLRLQFFARVFHLALREKFHFFCKDLRLFGFLHDSCSISSIIAVSRRANFICCVDVCTSKRPSVKAETNSVLTRGAWGAFNECLNLYVNVLRQRGENNSRGWHGIIINKRYELVLTSTFIADASFYRYLGKSWKSERKRSAGCWNENVILGKFSYCFDAGWDRFESY